MIHLHTFRPTDEGRFASVLRSDLHAHCALALFRYFVRTQDEGAMCSKISFGMILSEILEWANSVGQGDVQLLWSTSLRVVVLGLETR